MKNSGNRKRIAGVVVAALALAIVAAPVYARDKTRGRERHRREYRSDKRSDRHDRRSNRDRGRRDRRDSRHHRDRDRGGITFRGHVPIGHVVRSRSVYVPGYYENRWIEPVYATRYDDCGVPYRVLVREGYYDRFWVPGHYVTGGVYGGYGRHGSRHHGGGGLSVKAHIRF